MYTFISVSCRCYSHGEHDVGVYESLREGLLDVLNDYMQGDEHEDGINRQRLESLPDDDLMTELFDISTERRHQEGNGLVAIVESEKSIRGSSEQCVYLEMYYKHGEWRVSENWSDYIDEALEELRSDYEKDRQGEYWDSMSSWEQESLALEISEENVKEERGWGVVLRIPGTLIGEADE